MILEFQYLAFPLLFGLVTSNVDFVCPVGCACDDKVLDCRNLNLRQIPPNLSTSFRKIDLEGNNITQIYRRDFSRLQSLQMLHLQGNQIASIEEGSFRDLVSLTRLRLDRNLVEDISEQLFTGLPHIERLDISNNRLKIINTDMFRGLSRLKSLQLDHNHISCIHKNSFRPLQQLENLALSYNNITHIDSSNLFYMNNLKSFKLSNNPLHCDCHLSWLYSWIVKHPTLGLSTKCSSPADLASEDIVELRESQFKCVANSASRNNYCDQIYQCPERCSCHGTSVTCSRSRLHDVPINIPEGTTEILLDDNIIESIHMHAFSKFKQLHRIELGNNRISFIHPSAFEGLKYLSALSLYNNRITELPVNIFRGLTNLKLLLLNSNLLKCVHRDTFKDLHSMLLLSLFDNNIQSISNGTFSTTNATIFPDLVKLHLGRNPLICDCNLRWLNDAIKTSNVEVVNLTCKLPKRMNAKRIGMIRSKKFRCKESEKLITQRAGECFIDHPCPKRCNCEGTSIDCSHLDLDKVPNKIPSFATELKLADNRITYLEEQFLSLPRLERLDLSNNRIEFIAIKAFSSFKSLTGLDLSNNRLSEAKGSMFEDLRKLKYLNLRFNKFRCISNTSFLELPNLENLDLFNNEIQTISENSFYNMRLLSTLNLLDNPFVCNCNLKWLQLWLKQTSIVHGNPQCHGPSEVKSLRLTDIPAKDFSCEFNTIDSCSNAILCPPGCECVDSFVNCENRDIIKLSMEVEPDTKHMYMQHNMIQAIPLELNSLNQLVFLDLSHNYITKVFSGSISNLPNLTTIILSDNKITCIEPGAFHGLYALKILVLNNNNISAVSDESFRHLTSLTHLAINNNPLHCDCKLKWLSLLITRTYIESGVASCATPKRMADHLLLSTAAVMFSCDDIPASTETAIRSKCEVCLNNPCRNNGICTSDPQIYLSTCECQEGYKGQFCEKTINQCINQPCLNRGICAPVVVNGEETSFTCTCMDGFAGAKCEINIDDCGNHSCLNGTCIDGVLGYTCNCTAGFQGHHCEEHIDFCSAENNPCRNGALCVDNVHDYHCQCPVDYVGKNCTEEENGCIGNECQNGGQCVDEIGNYRCQCAAGFDGQFCNISRMVYNRLSTCYYNSCQNNGLCYDTGGKFACVCKSDYSGDRCQIQHGAGFRQRDSYIQMQAVKFTRGTNITIYFQSNQASGVLLYHGHYKQHLSVELVDKRIRLRYGFGIQLPHDVIEPLSEMDDGITHVIEILLKGGTIYVTIDNSEKKHINVTGGAWDLEQAPLFFGGIADEFKVLAKEQLHSVDVKSLYGCIGRVFINDKITDFSSHAVNSYRISTGCPATVKKDPCDVSMCDQGKCVPLDEVHYKCVCHRGWNGPMCKRVQSCEPKKRSEFKYYNECQSRKKIVVKNCEYKCGGKCCSTQKTKIRLVSFKCANGVKFKHQVRLPKKCKCTPC
uniref:Slit1 protein n=1 Tax=Meara stichopi TaxID=84115 RepID=A0A2P1DVD3_9BILA|nr:slit1 protein [Meara stichopi]